MFKKLLIANRGEIAVRIIRACKELGIETVAIYSEADKDSLHVQLADEAYCIGPTASKDSYLNFTNIVSVATLTGSEAIHPGYGFLAENADFAELCNDCNIVFVGPSPEAITKMGKKMLLGKQCGRRVFRLCLGQKGSLKAKRKQLRSQIKSVIQSLLKQPPEAGKRNTRCE